MGKKVESFNYQFTGLAGQRPQPYAVGERIRARRVTLINDRGGECVLDEPPIRVRITAAARDPDLGWTFEGRLYEAVDAEKARRLGITDTRLSDFLGADQPPGLYEWVEAARRRFDPTFVRLSEWHIIGRVVADPSCESA